MARFRRGESPRTVQAGYIARQAERAHAQGFSYKQIAETYGMNTRTLYEVRKGQTSGRNVFARGRASSYFNVVVRDDSDTSIRKEKRTHRTVTVIAVGGRSRFQAYDVAAAPDVEDTVQTELRKRAEEFERSRVGSPPFTTAQIDNLHIVGVAVRQSPTTRPSPELTISRRL